LKGVVYFPAIQSTLMGVPVPAFKTLGDARGKCVKTGANAWLFYLLTGLFVIAPLPLGSNRPWAWQALAGCGFLLLAALLFAWMRGKMPLTAPLRGRPIRVATGLLLMVVVWIFCQTIPLPPSWVAALSPKTFKVYQAARAVVPADGLYMPLSLNRDATFAAGLRSLFLLAMFLLLLHCLESRSRLKIFCLVIVLSGFFQAVYGSFMALSGSGHFLGGQDAARGTFVNRNHLAGYLEMTSALGMGLLLMAGRHGSWRHGLPGALRILLSKKALVRLMLIIMVAGLILTRSRMGNAAFFSSLLLTGLLAVVLSQYFRKIGVYSLLLSVLLVDVLLLGQWFGLEELAERIQQTSLIIEQRDEVGAYNMSLVGDFWLTGAGAASFIDIFPAYSDENLGVLYDHAHNDYLELLGELGVMGFIPLSAFVIIGFWQALRMLRCSRHSHAKAIGFSGCMGIISLSIHSTVDFNLQIPANAMLFISIFAIVYASRRISKDTA
jgi:O-antigen ligase